MEATKTRKGKGQSVLKFNETKLNRHMSILVPKYSYFEY